MNQRISGQLTKPSKKVGKWTRLEIGGMVIPRAAVLKIGDYLYQVKKRFRSPDGKTICYVEELKVISVRKTL